MKISRLLGCNLVALSLASSVYAATPLQFNTAENPVKPTVQATLNKATDKVNLNRADAKTLAAALKGIGLKRAQAIVAYRKEHGAFKSLQQLSKVRGISARFIKKNQQHLEQVLAIA